MTVPNGVSSHSVSKALRRAGPVWQKESFDHVLRSDEGLREKVDYICLNPVRKGLVRDADEYPWLWREWVEGYVTHPPGVAHPPSGEVSSSALHTQPGAATLHDKPFSVEGVRRLSWGKVSLDFDRPARVWWPMEGYNSYAADHRYPTLASARLIVEFALTSSAPDCTVRAQVQRS